MADVNKRVQLLKDNGDCFHCCGDHKPEDCPKKDRVCGGDKPNRGCAKGHKLHELFCKESNMCFSIIDVHSSSPTDDEGVVLSIMQVKACKKGLTASVFWDLGCTSNFVREQFAKACGFKGKSKKLIVKTLNDGGR